MLNATRTSRKAVNHMKNQADDMAEQFRHDCRMAAIKQVVRVAIAFTATFALLTWLVMRG